LSETGIITIDQFRKALESFGCTFSKYEVNALFRKYDTTESGRISFDEFCDMFAKIGSGVNPNLNPVFIMNVQPPADTIKLIKTDLIGKGLYGIRNFTQILRNLDKSNQGSVTRNGLLAALKEAGTSVNKHDLDKLYNYFDKNSQNVVSYPELLRIIRGDLSNLREDFIVQTWFKLDIQGTRTVKFEFLKASYDPWGEPNVRVGKTKPDHAMKEFIAQWTLGKDWKVSFNDFMDFYWDVSAGVDKDEDFESLIGNCWKVAEQEQPKEEKSFNVSATQSQSQSFKPQQTMTKSKVRFADNV